MSTNHFEYQDYMSIALKKNFIRLGGRLRTTSDTNTTNSNANGSFTFLGSGGNTALQNYINGTPSQFTITTYNNPTVSVTTVDAGLYAEDDWKPKSNITLSFGGRFETQNFIGDKADVAPRVALAYGVGKKKTGGPAVVVRAGFGLFYDRLSLAQQENTVQENGKNQIPSTTTVVPFSSACWVDVFDDGRDRLRSFAHNGSCADAVGAVDRQLCKELPVALSGAVQPRLGLLAVQECDTTSFNYQHVIGIHQLLNANLNAAADVTNPNAPIQDTYLTEGYYRQNQFITNFNYRGSAKWSLSSYYSLNFDTKSDTSGAGGQPTNPYNIGGDYGRASFATRSTLFLFGTFTLPHLITLSPLVSARSGTPSTSLRVAITSAF